MCPEFYTKPLNAQGKRTHFFIAFLAMSVRVAFVRKRIENALPEAVRTYVSIHSLREHSTRHCFDVIARVYPEAIYNYYDSNFSPDKYRLLRLRLAMTRMLTPCLVVTRSALF